MRRDGGGDLTGDERVCVRTEEPVTSKETVKVMTIHSIVDEGKIDHPRTLRTRETKTGGTEREDDSIGM